MPALEEINKLIREKEARVHEYDFLKRYILKVHGIAEQDLESFVNSERFKAQEADHFIQDARYQALSKCLNITFKDFKANASEREGQFLKTQLETINHRKKSEQSEPLSFDNLTEEQFAEILQAKNEFSQQYIAWNVGKTANLMQHMLEVVTLNDKGDLSEPRIFDDFPGTLYKCSDTESMAWLTERTTAAKDFINNRNSNTGTGRINYPLDLEMTKIIIEEMDKLEDEIKKTKFTIPGGKEITWDELWALKKKEIAEKLEFTEPYDDVREELLAGKVRQIQDVVVQNYVFKVLTVTDFDRPDIHPKHFQDLIKKVGYAKYVLDLHEPQEILDSCINKHKGEIGSNFPTWLDTVEDKLGPMYLETDMKKMDTALVSEDPEALPKAIQDVTQSISKKQKLREFQFLGKKADQLISNKLSDKLGTMIEQNPGKLTFEQLDPLTETIKSERIKSSLKKSLKEKFMSTFDIKSSHSSFGSKSTIAKQVRRTLANTFKTDTSKDRAAQVEVLQSIKDQLTTEINKGGISQEQKDALFMIVKDIYDSIDSKTSRTKKVAEQLIKVMGYKTGDEITPLMRENLTSFANESGNEKLNGYIEKHPSLKTGKAPVKLEEEAPKAKTKSSLATTLKKKLKGKKKLGIPKDIKKSLEGSKLFQKKKAQHNPQKPKS